MYILKNTTLSNIALKEIGLSIPASSQITISTQDVLLLSSEDSITELTPYINSGDIVLNDGTNDIDAVNALKWIQYPNRSERILYDNTTSGLAGPTVQTALDDIGVALTPFSLDRILYVAKNGNDTTGNGFSNNPFLTVKKAVEYAVANLSLSSTNPIAIEIAPGIYDEDPFTIPEWCLLRGYSTRTKINANNPNENLITISKNSSIRGITVSGVTDNTKYCIYLNASESGVASIIDLFITNSTNGMYFNNSSGTFNCTINDLLANGVSEHILRVIDNCRLTINNASILGNGTTTNGFENNGNSSLFIFNTKVDDSLHAVHCTGADGETQILNIEAQTCLIPVKQENSARIVLFGGNFDARNADVNDLSTIDGIFLNEIPSENRITLLSELSVGTAGLGKESSFGEGDSYQNGMLVYTYNGSTFTNVSDDAKTDTGTTVTFPGTGTNNALYFTTAFPGPEGSKIDFYGLKIDTVTAAVGGEIVAEYWNGSSWIEFNHMSTKSFGNYLPYAKQVFQRAQQEHIRFEDGIGEFWTESDPMSLGTDYKWIRFRIVSTLTTKPIFNSFKIHSNRTEINGDGYKEVFGKARPLKVLPFSYNSFGGANSSPTNQDLYYDDILATGRVENEFSSGGLLSNADKVGLNEYLPFDIDTSCKVKFAVTFSTQGSPSGTDTVGFRIYWDKSNDGSRIYETSGQAPSTTANRQEINVTQNVTQSNTQYTAIIDLDFSDYIPRYEDFTGDMVWLTLARNPDIDNYNDLVSVQQIRFIYASCNSGGHL